MNRGSAGIVSPIGGSISGSKQAITRLVTAHSSSLGADLMQWCRVPIGSLALYMLRVEYRKYQHPTSTSPPSKERDSRRRPTLEHHL